VRKLPDLLAPGVRWFDDWFAIREIAPGIHAIGEPRFHQINWNYLLVGRKRALLFDTGPGVRDISVVVESLTDLPVTALPSHMHFDHTGNLARFENIAIADLPVLRKFEKDDLLLEPIPLFLGHYEGMQWRPIAVRKWLPVGIHIDLGDRRLEIIHTPGHTPDHIALWDKTSNILLAADFLYPGPLYVQVPGANLADYETTAAALLARISDRTMIFGAHGQADDNGRHDAPQLQKTDLNDLLTALKKLRKSGEYPTKYVCNDRVTLLIGRHAYDAWQEVHQAI